MKHAPADALSHPRLGGGAVPDLGTVVAQLGHAERAKKVERAVGLYQRGSLLSGRRLAGLVRLENKQAATHIRDRDDPTLVERVYGKRARQ